MPSVLKTRVFMSGRSQHITIPAAFRVETSEVYIHKDPQTGDLVIQQHPRTLEEIFAALDALGIPEDFMRPEDRDQGIPETRDEL
jgi:antitoxin VapB